MQVHLDVSQRHLGYLVLLTDLWSELFRLDFFQLLLSLWEEHCDLARQNLTESLDEYHAREIKGFLAEASKKIRDLQKAARSRDESGTAAILQTIESKVQNAANIERKFGLALADLLNRFGMPDGKVHDAYYKTRPRPVYPYPGSELF